MEQQLSRTQPISINLPPPQSNDPVGEKSLSTVDHLAACRTTLPHDSSRSVNLELGNIINQTGFLKIYHLEWF